MKTLNDYIKKIQQVFNASTTVSKSQFKNNMTAHDAICQGFSSQELTEFYALGVKETFILGQNVFYEQDAPNTFHIILEGEAEVYISKTNEEDEVLDHVLAILKKDDVIGDMALVENKPRSASIRAKTDLTVLTFKMEDLKLKPRILLLLTRNMAKILSERLRFNNQVTVKKMEESLEQAQARNVLGVFMVVMFWFISLYTLSLTSLIGLKNHLSNTGFLSAFLIIFFTVGIVGAMRMTGLPFARFGISLKDGLHKTWQAVLYTLPLMLLFIAIKAYLVYFTANPQHIQIFSGIDEGMLDGQFNLGFYLSIMFLYAAFCPMQELVVRCALQSTFFYFLPGGILFREWNAIILSNLIFSSVHSHLSLSFAVLTFIPGIFWGVLFHKQRSFIAVSVSHILLGVWIVFVIGAKGIVYV